MASAEDEVDFEEEEVGVIGGGSASIEATAVVVASEEAISPRGRGSKARVKGRGHRDVDADRYEGRGGTFESLPQSEAGPIQSIEGWIIFITNIHPEAQEDDILDTFSEFGEVKNIQVNLDRRTGFVKGYGLIEYETHEEALEAVSKMNGQEILGQAVAVDWAFMKK